MDKLKTLNRLRYLSYVGYVITSIFIIFGIYNLISDMKTTLKENSKTLEVLKRNDSINTENTFQMMKVVRANTEMIGTQGGKK
jgi:hypothetical protein